MRRLVLAFLALSTSGCAWLMGLDRLPQPVPPFQPVEALRDVHAGPLHVRARFLGPGERITTAATPLGRIARAANPYGEDSLVFHLVVMNPGEAVAMILPSEATLEGPAGRKTARTLDDFRRRWPSWAVENPDHEADRDAAMAFVLQTVLLDRLVGANAETEGRIAFPSFRPGERMVLRLPMKLEGRRETAEIAWVIR